MRQFPGREKLLPVCWIILALLMLGGDFLARPYLQFPVLFLLPVILAAGRSGSPWALGLAAGMPLARACLQGVWADSRPEPYPALNAGIQMLVLSTIAACVHLAAPRLPTLVTGAPVLRGLLPTCGVCKRIRNGKNEWHPWDRYVTVHADAQFTHTLCPDCLRSYYAKEAHAQW